MHLAPFFWFHRAGLKMKEIIKALFRGSFLTPRSAASQRVFAEAWGTFPSWFKPLLPSDSGPGGCSGGRRGRGGGGGGGRRCGSCPPIGPARRPSAQRRAPIGGGRGNRRCSLLIEAQGGEKVINLHPSRWNHLNTQTRQRQVSPWKQMSLIYSGCKTNRSRTEDAPTPARCWLRTSAWCRSLLRPVVVCLRAGVPHSEFGVLQTSSCSCWIILLLLASGGPTRSGEKPGNDASVVLCGSFCWSQNLFAFSPFKKKMSLRAHEFNFRGRAFCLWTSLGSGLEVDKWGELPSAADTSHIFFPTRFTPVVLF